ncbi:hypothetical protein MMC14_002965 [Varicellaria rhodocarpa]|nr:hypothetical protein [Varicellaria rhodocarpa]
MAHNTGNHSFSAVSAPLPSPSAHQAGQHFSFPPPSQRPKNPASSIQPNLYGQTSSTTTQKPVGASNVDASRGSVNDPTASSPYLKDVNLVAEAARRAQMALLLRDMEEIVL